MELKSGMAILDIEEYNQLKKLQEKIATESSLVIYFNLGGVLSTTQPRESRFYFYTNVEDVRNEVEKINEENNKRMNHLDEMLRKYKSIVSRLEQENASLRKEIDWHKNKGFFARLFNA